MAGFIAITFDGKKSIEEIQKRFREHLSEKEILKTTARAINETANRVQGYIRKEVRKEYTVNNKYLGRMSYVSKYAAGTNSSLFTHVNFSYRPVPMIGFENTGKIGSKRPISVTIRNGHSKILRHAFVATLKSGHIGIFARGYYNKGKFVYKNIQTGSGKTRISELRSASPFAMMSVKPMRDKIRTYIDRALPGRLEFFLNQKIQKMIK